MSGRGERRVFVGESGTGKTHHMKRAVARRLAERKAKGIGTRALFVLDPTGDSDDGWWPKGAVIAERLGDALRALKDPTKTAIVLKYSERAMSFAPLERIPELVVVIDEGAEYMSPGVHGAHESLKQLYRKGRHNDTDMFTGSQRVSELNGVVWANKGSQVYILPLTYPPDRAALEAALGIVLPKVHEWRRPEDPAAPATARVPFVYPDDFEHGRVKPGLIAHTPKSLPAAKPAPGAAPGSNLFP